jgi:pimeloyl-ACP methyl ester carboxylesterase
MSSILSSPPPSTAGDGQRPPFTRATVVDGLTETLYRRAGHGAPVVVLAAGDSPAGVALLDALPRRFRVIAPELPASRRDGNGGGRDVWPAFPTWLSGFLDGLGLGGVAVVAEERFGGAALGFALLEPARVERLVLVLDGGAHPPPFGALADALGHAGVPLLVSWLAGADRGESAAEVARFLLESPAAAD